jgi:hypothetical protein
MVRNNHWDDLNDCCSTNLNEEKLQGQLLSDNKQTTLYGSDEPGEIQKRTQSLPGNPAHSAIITEVKTGTLFFVRPPFESCLYFFGIQVVSIHARF